MRIRQSFSKGYVNLFPLKTDLDNKKQNIKDQWFLCMGEGFGPRRHPRRRARDGSRRSAPRQGVQGTLGPLFQISRARIKRHILRYRFKNGAVTYKEYAPAPFFTERSSLPLSPRSIGCKVVEPRIFTLLCPYLYIGFLSVRLCTALRAR